MYPKYTCADTQQKSLTLPRRCYLLPFLDLHLCYIASVYIGCVYPVWAHKSQAANIVRLMQSDGDEIT